MSRYKVDIEKRISKDKLIVDAKKFGKDPAAHMSDLAAMENRINLKIDTNNADLKVLINTNIADLKQLIIDNT
ncbi:MAG: hypothetical protein LBM72_02175 [Mycoplasmataceae bacterium]|jgi:hypothetical protein|nr:hypothetical protein [Mycoplasmataceae bacterium]